MNEKSISRLKGVNPILISAVQRAAELSDVVFEITEGLRTVERQKELYDAGKSHTMNSYHLVGNAVDVVAYLDGKVSWDLKLYSKINEAFQEAAKDMGIKITWGGTFKKLVDGPHFQLEK